MYSNCCTICQNNLVIKGQGHMIFIQMQCLFQFFICRLYTHVYSGSVVQILNLRFLCMYFQIETQKLTFKETAKSRTDTGGSTGERRSSVRSGSVTSSQDGSNVE